MNRRALLIGSGAAVAAIGLPAAYLALRDQGRPATDLPPLKLTYNVEEQSGEKALLAQILQAQLRKAGILVALEPVTSPIYNDRIAKGLFEAALTLWYLDYNDPEGFLTDFYSKSGYRLSKYQSPDYDKSYLAALFAPDEVGKRDGFRRAAAIIDKDLVWIPLYANNELFLLKPGAEGFRSNAYQYYDYRGVDQETIRAATDIEVQTLDPAQTYDLASKHLVTQSYEGLVALDANNQIVPALARGWRFSTDGRALTFDLRPDVAFHPATPTSTRRILAAVDVKASFERTARVASPYAYIFDQVVGIDEFRAKSAASISGLVADGDLTFTIHLKRPFPTMLPWLLAPAAYVLPAGLPDDYDFARGSRGTGPFVLEAWDGSSARFRAHQNYWASEHGVRSPLAKRLTVSVMKDASVQLLAYSRGELDILNVPLALYSAVLGPNGALQAKWAGSRLRVVELNNLKFVAFNMAKTPWGASRDLRGKVAAAIDRKEIVRQLFRGQAREAQSVLPPGILT